MSQPAPWYVGLPARLARQRAVMRECGPINWIRLQRRLRFTSRADDHTPFRLGSRHARYPVLARPHSSDVTVFLYMLVERLYGCLDEVVAPGLVIDCGANVGYASVYFLSRFPDCRVIAVEPDPENFALLQRNLEPYGTRARAMHAAVWSHPAPLKIASTRYRDGRDWTRQVGDPAPGEHASVRGVDVGSLLDDAACERISILKMNIEGAEAVVFSANYERWIDRVDNIAIELHQDSHFGDARAIFMKAIEGRGFVVRHARPLTVCQRPANPPAGV